MNVVTKMPLLLAETWDEKSWILLLLLIAVVGSVIVFRMSMGSIKIAGHRDLLHEQKRIVRNLETQTNLNKFWYGLSTVGEDKDAVTVTVTCGLYNGAAGIALTNALTTQSASLVTLQPDLLVRPYTALVSDTSRSTERDTLVQLAVARAVADSVSKDDANMTEPISRKSTEGFCITVAVSTNQQAAVGSAVSDNVYEATKTAIVRALSISPSSEEVQKRKNTIDLPDDDDLGEE